MPTSSKIVPSIPEETVHVAKVIYKIENMYLRIGDQMVELFEGLSLSGLDPTSERSINTLRIFALVTVFQCIENMPDQSVPEAVRNRMDWKYALHLPINSPVFTSIELCNFRQILLFNPEGLNVFQEVINRLGEIGYVGSSEADCQTPGQLLKKVCDVSRIEQISRAINQTIEALAVYDPEWLRQITLPHWYERYNQKPQKSPNVNVSNSLEFFIRAYRDDIHYILKSFENQDMRQITLIPEIQQLRQLFQQHYEKKGEQIVWRSDRCKTCSGLKQGQ